MSESYKSNSIFLAYSKWHYTDGIRELVSVFSNFLWFISNFFSFTLLFKTLFAPWKRMGEVYEDTFDLGRIASTFVINSLMRIVGFCTKTVVLLVGFLSFLIMFLFSLVIFVIWILAPLFIMGTIVLSITFFIL